MQTQAIIFDLDGVIVDTAKFHYKAWKILADKLGMFFNEEINERLKGVSRIKSLEIILGVNNALDKYTEAQKEILATEKNELYKELISTLTPDDILPGVLDFITKAKENGIKTAIASVSKNAPAVLNALGINDKFDYIADASKVKNSKPDPEIFLTCAEGLGVNPQNCIGVEDAQAGIEAIKSAGMYAIGINVAVTSVNPDIQLKSTAQLNFAKMIF